MALSCVNLDISRGLWWFFGGFSKRQKPPDKRKTSRQAKNGLNIRFCGADDGSRTHYLILTKEFGQQPDFALNVHKRPDYRLLRYNICIECTISHRAFYYVRVNWLAGLLASRFLLFMLPKDITAEKERLFQRFLLQETDSPDKK